MASIVFRDPVLSRHVAVCRRTALSHRHLSRTPAPLKIPTTPAPSTKGGVVLRMMREVVSVREPVQGEPVDLGPGHGCFMPAWRLVLLRHLRYFTEPVWALVASSSRSACTRASPWCWAVAGLWARRMFVERIRYISTPSDHLMLALFLAIGLSGLTMRVRCAWRCDRREGYSCSV